MDYNISDCIVYASIHQPISLFFPEYIVPIQAGAALSDIELCEVRDDIGNNISGKNKEYSELTALYWIWKNDNHSVISFNHYRRYFKIAPKEILKLLNHCDVILPPFYYFRQSLEQEYVRFHNKEDWEILQNVLTFMHPEMEEDMKYVFNNNCLIPYNMMISRRNFLEEYCDWLFPILFEIEAHLNTASYTIYQKRALGFMAERLFTLYTFKRKPSVHVGRIAIPENATYFKYAKYSLGKLYNKYFFQGKRTIWER